MQKNAPKKINFSAVQPILTNSILMNSARQVEEMRNSKLIQI
jgi:hypothetical protein